MAWAMKMHKPFFVGQRSLRASEKQPRKQLLVGFRFAADYQGPLPQECHLVIADGEIAGRVTSIARSPSLGYALGLALVRPELASPGVRLSIRLSDGQMVHAEVAPTPFYDPDSLQQKEAA